LTSPPTQKNWVLSPEAFAGLLAALDPDVGRAAEEYEAVRRRLVRLFEWRGVEFAEDYADETINRVARKLEEGERIQNLSGYIGGVARLVLLEAHKESARARAAFEQLPPPVTYAEPVEDDEDERRLGCFRSCMGSLPEETRALILEYYGEDGGGARIEKRKRLARALGLEMNALRNRALRTRDRLERCIGDCAGDGVSPPAR
jgi:DNA-directed RNA polymerase specialized sigma24 family protein